MKRTLYNPKYAVDQHRTQDCLLSVLGKVTYSNNMKAKAANTTTMRIAIAGAGGFAYILAQELCKGANAVLVLSRQVSNLLLATFKNE